MESINCIICGSSSYTQLEIVHDRLEKNSSKFTIVKCDCEFVYLNPRPSRNKIKKYYNYKNYIPHNTKIKIKNLYTFFQKLIFLWKKYIINKYIKRGRLLDIGCGVSTFGEFMISC